MTHVSRCRDVGCQATNGRTMPRPAKRSPTRTTIRPRPPAAALPAICRKMRFYSRNPQEMGWFVFQGVGWGMRAAGRSVRALLCSTGLRHTQAPVKDMFFRRRQGFCFHFFWGRHRRRFFLLRADYLISLLCCWLAALCRRGCSRCGGARVVIDLRQTASKRMSDAAAPQTPRGATPERAREKVH